MEQVRTDQLRKPCFALTVIIRRFYTVLLTKGNGVSMATAEEEKTLPIYIMKVPGNHLNNAQETNLNWNRVVIQLQECKRPSER